MGLSTATMKTELKVVFQVMGVKSSSGLARAIMEADDDGTYVVKFTAAGQGRKALVAEVIAAGLALSFALAVVPFA